MIIALQRYCVYYSSIRMEKNQKESRIHFTGKTLSLGQFRELRPTTSFRVDIKTQGTTGKEIVAAADGYVYRINATEGSARLSIFGTSQIFNGLRAFDRLPLKSTNMSKPGSMKKKLHGNPGHRRTGLSSARVM